MQHTFLLGATKNNDIVFGEFGFYSGNRFHASFYTVHPFDANTIDLAEQYQYRIDDMDKEWLIDMCDEYDCKPSELAEEIANTCDDVTEIVDCSLYDEFYTISNADWYFESCSCGQHDTRKEIVEYINKDAYDKLHELWDEYHLKEVDEDIINEVEKIADILAQTDEEEWIIDFIERHENELH